MAKRFNRGGSADSTSHGLLIDIEWEVRNSLASLESEALEPSPSDPMAMLFLLGLEAEEDGESFEASELFKATAALLPAKIRLVRSAFGI